MVNQEFHQLKLFVNELFPDPEKLNYMVSPDLQQKELYVLRTGRRTEQLFFIVDFVNLKIIEASGLEEIGYLSDRFTFKQYLGTIPAGGFLQLITLLGKQTFILSSQSHLEFLNPKFVAHIPMTTGAGKVMLTKRTISPWQFTDTGKISAYLSEFTLLKPYENEPMNPRFINIMPKIETKFNNLVARLFANLPASTNLFSPKEMLIIKLYVEPNGHKLTIMQVADLAHVTVNTIQTHNKNIIAKAKSMFGENFPAKTAYEVALFLKNCGLL